MQNILRTVSMIATIVNATIALSNSVVQLTTRKHKYDIDLGINMDYKSDLTMLADAITNTVKRAYNYISNLIIKHTIVAGYAVEITLALLFIYMNISLIYVEIIGLAFLAYRLYIYLQENYNNSTLFVPQIAYVN